MRTKNSEWKPAPLDTVDPDEVVVTRWDSLDDLLATKNLKSNENHSVSFLFDKNGKPGIYGSGAEWYGANNGTDYAAKVAAGSREMATALAECKAQIGELPKIANIKRRRKMGEEGDGIDIDRLYQGEIDTMWEDWRSEYRAGSTRVVRLVINVSAAWFHEGPALRWRGAAACVMADVLESAGYQTEIVMASYSKGISDNEPDRRHLFEVPLKHFGEVLDIDHLASTIATQSSLRVAMFMAKLAVVERCSGELGYAMGGMRPPAPLVARTDIWVDGVTSKEMALDCLRHQVQELTGKKEEVV